MTIYKIGELYVIKGRYNNKTFAVTGETMTEALEKLFSEIAIFRSVTAWNK